MPKLYQVIEAIETRLPPSASEPWDVVGLLSGDVKAGFKGAVIGVDLTQKLVDEALKARANLIVIHHPPLFPKGRGITKLVMKEGEDLPTLVLKCFQKKIAIYVAHTKFDRCALDAMMKLADELGGDPVARVWENPDTGETLLKKLVTYVPEPFFEKVRDALAGVGCGHIGNYDSCSFSVLGTGNFRPLEKASPFLGMPGELETVAEVRIETLVVSGMEKVVIETLKFAHPYEEVAYDLFPVEQLPPKKGLIWGLGYGFVAELAKPVSYDLFTKRVKKVFGVDHFLTSNFTPKSVRRIAFTPGKGSSFVNAVKSYGVDVYVTGEVGYHGSIDAAKSQLNIIELGHRESELYFLKTFASWFKEWKLSVKAVDERMQRIV
jgi:dinuclear metal center YbgI/SA1388 family protein